MTEEGKRQQHEQWNGECRRGGVIASRWTQRGKAEAGEAPGYKLEDLKCCHLTEKSSVKNTKNIHLRFRYTEWLSETHSVMSNSLWPHGLYSPRNSPGQNARVGSYSLLQGIFPTQGSNPGLPHCRQILYTSWAKWSPGMLKWIVYPFSSRSSLPRTQIRVTCIAAGFFTSWATRRASGILLLLYYREDFWRWTD